jgi:hypothetical protein
MSSSAAGGGSAFRDFNKSRFPRLRRENDSAAILRRENDKAVILRRRRGICSLRLSAANDLPRPITNPHSFGRGGELLVLAPHSQAGRECNCCKQVHVDVAEAEAHQFPRVDE